MLTKVRLEKTLTSVGFLVFTLTRFATVIRPAKPADQPSARPTFSGFRNALIAKCRSTRERTADIRL